jgi:alkaline phosphatase D
MKRVLLAFSLFSGFSLWAQQPENPADYSVRSGFNPALAPFYHGVASGDPLSDRVILWTRITLDAPADPVSVNWKIATDTGLVNVVNSGTATTNVSKDYTVKVDATGLQPNTWYYYGFSYGNQKSITGRTRTLPVGNVDSLRFAVVSCQDYQNGYYNAYHHMATRNDIDAVFHLGDFIYEYAANSSVGREHEPAVEIISLSDYRIRHSQYRLDADLRSAMQQYPFICIWDDHETTNNSYKDGAENHTPGTEGNWADRTSFATNAYSEWMPIRLPEVNNNYKIYRRFTWGNLVDAYFLETRLLARDEQVAGPLVDINNATVLDTNRRLLGPEQMEWLRSGFAGSSATWQLLAQQVMVAPLLFDFLGQKRIINTDQWDGYVPERNRLYSHVQNENVDNLVVLTGDIHTSWANDLPLPNYSNGTNSLGVEFVGTSITSENLLDLPGALGLIQSSNPHIKWADLDKHGYMITDMNQTRTQNDWYFVSTVASTDYTVSCGKSYFVNQGQKSLTLAQGCATQTRVYPPLAPVPVLNASLIDYDNVLVFSVYPNPFMEQVVVQFHLIEQDDITLEILDINGKKVYSSFLGKVPKGLQYAHFDGSQLAKGQYVILLKGNKKAAGKMLLKIE